MPGISPQGVFLSYRRRDAGPYARLLQRELSQRLPDVRVFMDLDSIEGGLDFTRVIREAVDSSAVLVALIGREWATLVDDEGARRLDNPDDYVRFEIQTALERGARVIPVLIDGAEALRPQQLPAEIEELARLNALELSYVRYQNDADRLLDLIQRVLTAEREQAEAEHPEEAAEAREEAELTALQARANSAEVAALRGDKAGARDQFAALVSVCEWVLGPDHPETLGARSGLARWTGEAGDEAAARDQFAALVPVYERVLGPDHPETLAARSGLARWTGEAGDKAAARDQFAALVPVYERVLGPDHWQTLAARSMLAKWTGAAGDATRARDQYAALVRQYERVLGPFNSNTKVAQMNLEYWTKKA